MRVNAQRSVAPSVIRTACLTGVIAALVACSGSSPARGLGEIVGRAPICYGPGPNDNLKPLITIRAVRGDGLVRTIQMHTSDGHNGYRMTLPPGTYTVSTYSGHVTTRVRASQTTENVDLPQPGCS